MITGTSLSIAGNGSITGTLTTNTVNATALNVAGLSTLQGVSAANLNAGQATFSTFSSGQGNISGLLTVNGLQVTGPLSAGSFNPQSISTGALTASSANIQGTLSAGIFNPANISTGNIAASTATISGALSVGSFNPANISTGTISATSASISGTLNVGSFNPSSISTGALSATSANISGTLSAGSLGSASATTMNVSGSITALTMTLASGMAAQSAVITGNFASITMSGGIANPYVVNLSSGGVSFAGYNVNGVQHGAIVPSGAGVAYSSTSDQRLKIFDQEIQPEESGRIIDKLEALWFRWKSDPGAEKEPGFFAQAVHKVYRWAVTPGTGNPKDGGFVPWQMDAAKLMPIVIAELKHLRARVAELEDSGISGRG